MPTTPLVDQYNYGYWDTGRLSYQTMRLGNVLVVWVCVGAANYAFSAGQLSGGGVSTWNFLRSGSDGNLSLGIYWGVITSGVGQGQTVNFSAGGIVMEMALVEIGVPGAAWHVDVSAIGVSVGASSNIQYPSLTPTQGPVAGGIAFVGYGYAYDDTRLGASGTAGWDFTYTIYGIITDSFYTGPPVAVGTPYAPSYNSTTSWIAGDVVLYVTSQPVAITASAQAATTAIVPGPLQPQIQASAQAATRATAYVKTVIQKMGSLTAVANAGGAAITFTVPAAGIPAGAVIVITGITSQGGPSAISDSKSNTWTNRLPPWNSSLPPPQTTPGYTTYMDLWDCRVTTSLVSGDTITVTGLYKAVAGAWYSGMDLVNYFDAVSVVNAFNGQAANGVTNPVLVSAVGNVVIAAFGTFTTGTAGSTFTAGAPYTLETQAKAGNGADSQSVSMAWESKLSTVAGLDTATMTIAGVSGWQFEGLVASYGTKGPWFSASAGAATQASCVMGIAGVVPATFNTQSIGPNALGGTQLLLTTQSVYSATWSSSPTMPSGATGWTEVYAYPTAGNITPTASAPEFPSGFGWLFDNPVLENQWFRAGNWVPTFTLSNVQGTLVATPVCRVWAYNIGRGTYRRLAPDIVAPSVSITTGSTPAAFPTTPLPRLVFAPGERLYIEVLVNITTGYVGTPTRMQVQVDKAPGATIVTPGFAGPGFEYAGIGASAQAATAATCSLTTPVMLGFANPVTSPTQAPGSVVSSGGGSWNPVTVDGGTASNLGSGSFTNDLLATNFGFRIPPTAYTVGVLLTMNRQSSNGNVLDAYNYGYPYLNPNAEAPVVKNMTAWPTTATAASYGGPGSRWMSTPTGLTPAIINGTNFGVGIAAWGQLVTQSATISGIRLAVSYVSGVAAQAATAATCAITAPWKGPPTRIGSQSPPTVFSGASNISSAQWTVPAAGVPVGAVLIIFGAVNGAGNVAISDPRGNTWNVRQQQTTPSGLCWLFDTKVTTALVSGDVVTITFATASAYCFQAVWYSGMDPAKWFDAVGIGPYITTGTTQTPPPVTTSSPNELVISYWFTQRGSTPQATVATPSTGYTLETGGTASSPGYAAAMGWESKIGSAPATEQPSMLTYSQAINIGASSMTFAYGGTTRVSLTASASAATSASIQSGGFFAPARLTPTVLGKAWGPHGGASSGFANPCSYTVSGGGIPAGAVIVVVGSCYMGGTNAITLSDTKGNTWNYRMQPNVAVQGWSAPSVSAFLADCRVTTPLISGDVITLTRPVADYCEWFLAWYSNLDPSNWFDGVSALATWNSVTAQSCGTLATTQPNDLVGGFFANNCAALAAPTFTAGSGYTGEAVSQQTQVDTSRNWSAEVETRLGGGVPTTEQATLTLSKAGSGGGFTYAYIAGVQTAAVNLTASAQAATAATAPTVPVAGPVAQLVDRFNDLSQWTVVNGSPVAGSGQLQVPADTSEVVSKNWYSLTGSGAFVLLTGPAPPPGPPLRDNFATLDATKWTPSAGAFVAANQLHLPITGGASNLLTALAAYDMAGSYAAVQVPQVGLQGSSRTVFYLRNAGDTARVAFWIDGSGGFQAFLRAYVTTGPGAPFPASATFDPVNHQWLRIREVAGTIFWDTSRDGLTWTNFYNVANPLGATLVTPILSGGNGDGVADQDAIFDNFNILPSTVLSRFTMLTVTGQTIEWRMTSNNRVQWFVAGIAGDTCNQDGSGVWPWPGAPPGAMWLRIRESAGVLYFDVSDMGVTWSPAGSVSEAVAGVTALDAIQVHLRSSGG